MRRKLFLLNIALIALLAALGLRFQQVRTAAQEREARVLGQKIEPTKYPPLPAAPPVPPIVAANYIDVATHMLMARDRNPNVIIDPEPVKEKPKMPPLPVVQGMLNFGGDPSLIMSDKPGAPQKTYHQGEKVGAFKLVAFDSEHVVLDWEGEKVERKLDDLLEKTPPPAAGSATSAPAGAAVAATAPPPTATPQGPGVDIGGGYKGCQPNDSTPTGTVQNGLRKVEIATPFGRSCRWEPAK